MAENELKIINNAIGRYLAGREHSKFELLRKLLSKEYDAELCHQQINKFTEANLQSDARFAESFVRGRVNKGIGEQRIRAELKEHNISSDTIKQAIVEQNIDWFELVSTVYQKKYGKTPASDWKEQQKRSRFLQYRGFDLEQIRYVNPLLAK
jgi:regulatory protein